MTARKTRPALGADVSLDMSERDTAAALGVSKAEINRWKRLAAVPVEVFESRLTEALSRGHPVTASMLLRSPEEPAPARGRVERALEAVRGMTTGERTRFLVRLREFA